MKIVVAPDKFKGSLPAAQVAAAIAAGLRSGLARAGRPAAELVTIPVADGGEGTVESGARRIVLDVGGSASTDGGAGLLQALGARVLGASGELAAPMGGGALRDVTALDLTGLHAALQGAEIILAADVANPLTGPDGAAEVYGPQKGASPAEVTVLAAGLRRWAAVAAATIGTEWSQVPGAGRQSRHRQ